MRGGFEVLPPLKVTHVRLIIFVQVEQKVCQCLCIREIINVNEGVGGIEVLIVFSWWTQNYRDRPCHKRPVNFLCDVVFVD